MTGRGVQGYGSSRVRRGRVGQLSGQQANGHLANAASMTDFEFETVWTTAYSEPQTPCSEASGQFSGQIAARTGTQSLRVPVLSSDFGGASGIRTPDPLPARHGQRPHFVLIPSISRVILVLYVPSMYVICQGN